MRTGRYSQTGPDAIWRNIVKSRADNSCEVCGKRQSPRSLHAHHLYSYAEYPQYRTDPSFGVCLCKTCHIDLFHFQYGAITTPEQFYEFKENYKSTHKSKVKKIKIPKYKIKVFKSPVARK